MKTLLFSLIVLIINLPNITAQNSSNTYNFWNADMQAIAKPESKEGWVKFKNTLNTPVSQILIAHKTAFGLGTDDSMALIKNWTTITGVEHFKYQQYYKGIKVIGGEFVLHKDSNNSITGNGNIYKGISMSVNPIMPISQILDSCIFLFNTEFMQTTSVINSISFNYFLNLAINIETTGVELIYDALLIDNNNNLHCYINANNGELLKVLNNKLNALSNIETLYNGSQNIEMSINITDTIYDTIYSINGYQIFTYEIDTLYPPGFFLNDTSKIQNIECIGFNYYQSGTSSNKYEFIKFKSNQNAEKINLNAATQALWGVQNYLDYIFNEYGLNSIDTAQNKINIFIPLEINHYDSFGASFDIHLYTDNLNNIKDSIAITFMKKNTDIFTIGHEMFHGLIEYGPKFQRNGETYIMHEGFSDMSGIIFEKYISENLGLNINNDDWTNNYYNPEYPAPYSLKDPKKYISPLSNNPYPDYYHGSYWKGLNDYDYHHNNSLVLSHWFYLISEGAVKTNEIGETYYIPGIGIDNAAHLIFEMITGQFLTSTATFHDVREASFQVINDSCYIETLANAWDCVGVYDSNFVFVSNNIFNDTITTSAIIDTNATIEAYIVIAGNVTIENNDVYIVPNSNIIVQNGATLTINNANLFFADNSGIIIEGGGNLIIDSSVLTYGLDSTVCFFNQANNKLWKGIVLNGNGIIDIDNSIISYSDSGIVVKAPNFTLKNSSYLNNMAPLFINSGMLSSTTPLIDNNLFQNDDDYLFSMHKPYKLLQIDPLSNANIINNNFVDSLAQVYISAVNIENNSLIATGNINIEDNRFINCNVGVNSDGATKYNLNSNTFTSELNNCWSNDYFSGSIAIQSANNFRKTNIESNIFQDFCIAIHTEYSDSLEVKKNQFYNSKKGIEIYNNSRSIIVQNKFTDCDLGISANNVSFMTLSKDTITGNHANRQAILIALASDSLVLDNNVITDIGKGIEIKSSEKVWIKNNILNNLMFTYNTPIGYGIFMQSCQNYEIKDNTIDGGNIPPPDNIPTGSPGIRGIVVEHSVNGNNKIFRNEILNTRIGIQTQLSNTDLRMKCNTTKSKTTGLMVFDVLESQGIGCNLDPVTNKQLLPGNDWQNICNPTSNGFKDIKLDASALNHSFSYFAHAYGIGGERTAPECNNINTGLGQYTTCNGLGAPQQLMASDFCNDINLYTGWRRQEVEPGISIANIPQEIIDLLAEKLNIANKMIAIEAQITDSDTQRDLVNDLNQHQAAIANLNRLIVNLYERIGNTAAANLLLEQEASIDAKMLLAQSYIEQNDPLNAQRIINEILLMNTPDAAYFNEELRSAYELNKDYTTEILEIENNVRANNRTITALTDVEKTNLRFIRAEGLPISTKAECLLALNGDDLLIHPIKEMSQEYINQLSTEMVFNYQLSISPNPASSDVVISYDLPLDAGVYSLKVIDNYQNIGAVKFTQNISATSSFSLSVNSYISGVYTVVLFRDDLSVASAQLVVVH